MFRQDIALHVVRTVKGVGKSVLVGGFMETFNHSWDQKMDGLIFYFVCACLCVCVDPLTYLSTLSCLGFVNHDPWGEIGHLPRPELLRRRHIDQILHHRVTIEGYEDKVLVFQS